MLKGKVAVVTGGTRGIGYAIVKKYLENGAKVVLFGSRQETVDKALSSLKAENADWEVAGDCPDLSDAGAVKAAIEKIKEQFGRIDILVNNAGIVSDWNKSYEVNTKGTWYCSEAARPYLKKVSGNIVILTSASIFSGGTGIPQYVATKAGSYALTMFLAREYAKEGIRVNGIAPAVIMSKMLATRFGSEQAVREHYKQVMPLGKVGEPEDIANIALFLSSSMASYLCGEVLIADGGRMHIG